MSVIVPLTACPVCDSLVGVHSRPHCINTSCTWNFCNCCGWTYDRFTGAAFIQRKDPNISEWKAGEAA